jgi:hypothetical protein
MSYSVMTLIVLRFWSENDIPFLCSGFNLNLCSCIQGSQPLCLLHHFIKIAMYLQPPTMLVDFFFDIGVNQHNRDN